jgi:methionine aminopeptidase
MNDEKDFETGAMIRLMNRNRYTITMNIVKSGDVVQIDTGVDIDDFPLKKSGKLTGYQISEAIEIAISQLETIKKSLIERGL